MLFEFIKYVQPTWYFNLIEDQFEIPYWVDFEQLPIDAQQIIETDFGYSSLQITKLDAAFQAWHKGVISQDVKHKLEVSKVLPTRYDNYRFLRRYYHPIWSFYALFLRLITLKNPFKEVSAFLKNKSVKRLQLHQETMSYPEYDSFDSSLVTKEPLVSVIIPTLNRYDYLRDAISDVLTQDYQNTEVIVIDQSNPFNLEFYSEFDNRVKVVNQVEKALWKARNHAINLSKGEYILLFDDDSRVESDWITHHIKCLDFFSVDLSSGVSISTVGEKVPQRYSYFAWSDQLDTGNVLLKKEIFKKIGSFDRQFEKMRMGDGEFGLRALLNGYTNVSNPLSKRLHLKVGVGGLRQMGSWDAYRPKKFTDVRPIPSVLYLFRKYFGDEAAKYALLKNVPASIIPYRFKSSRSLKVIGYALMLFLSPYIIFKVWQSWKIADNKLRQGPILEAIT